MNTLRKSLNDRWHDVMIDVIDKSIRPSIRCQLGNLTRVEEYIARKKEIRNLTQLDDDYLQHENETGGIKNL